MTTGRRIGMSGHDLQLYLGSLYPGMRTDGFQATTVQGEHGQWADVEGRMRPSELLALKVGSPAITVCSLKNPFGVVHVQVTATEVGTDAVAVRVRVQHEPLRSNFEIPDASETAWPPESAPVRATYGASTEMQVTDQNGKTWKIVLHPERLRGARC